MIVGIDATVAVTGPLSGVGYHIIRLVEALDAAAHGNESFRLFYQDLGGDARDRAAALVARCRRAVAVPVPFIHTHLHTLHQIYSSLLLPAMVWRHRCDVFHGPAHTIPPIRRIPTVVTIHDLAFLRHDIYEASFAAALRLKVSESIRDATAVIALSQNTKRDIAELTHREHDVHVIYGAGNFPTADEARPAAGDRAELEGLGIGPRYVLYVGDFNPRKNLPYLIESFALLKRDAAWSDLQLVLAGNSDRVRTELVERARGRGLAERDMVLPGRVSDDRLRILYRNADAFALCSLMEGFTLVTLEAMSYGVPVVATNTSSIAEGTGAAAELVPLEDSAAVARALQTALTPGPRRDEMRRMGLQRAAQFTWGNNAAATLALYRTLAGRPA